MCGDVFGAPALGAAIDEAIGAVAAPTAGDNSGPMLNPEGADRTHGAPGAQMGPVTGPVSLEDPLRCRKSGSLAREVYRHSPNRSAEILKRPWSA
jgi:hypothetical protein